MTRYNSLFSALDSGVGVLDLSVSFGGIGVGSLKDGWSFGGLWFSRPGGRSLVWFFLGWAMSGEEPLKSEKHEGPA